MRTRFGLEEMSGKQWYEDRSTGFLAIEELAKVLGEVSDFLIDRYRHPFNTNASLQHQSPKFALSASKQVGPCSRTSMSIQGQSRLLYSLRQHYLAQIAEEQTHTNLSIYAYVVYAYLKDKVSQLLPIAINEPEHFS